MARILIAGNWKMHLNTSQASLLTHRLQERIKIHRDVEVVLFPSMMLLQPLSLQIDRRKFRLGAQNGYHKDEGAFTGEVAISAMHDLVHYVLVGHSERRHIFNEHDGELSQKVAAALRNEISPILCVGETKQERLNKETNQVLHDQVTVGLKYATSKDLENIVIAYEPVWAISSGHDYSSHEIAKPGEVAQAVKVIRNNLSHMFGPQVAQRVRILYGGSVSADTARGYLEVEGIEGLLVGGASLNYHQFADIVDAAFRLTKGADNG
jgi:triosephosphate isomerase